MIKFIVNYGINRKRFLKVFEKLEKEGCNLFISNDLSDDTQRKVRNYIKNLSKIVKLYNKFYGS